VNSEKFTGTSLWRLWGGIRSQLSEYLAQEKISRKRSGKIVGQPVRGKTNRTIPVAARLAGGSDFEDTAAGRQDCYRTVLNRDCCNTPLDASGPRAIVFRP
jgi:hypothetical protein